MAWPLTRPWKHHGRRQPYTEAGVKRLPCFRCGKPAEYQWSICSDRNRFRPVCAECDVRLNALVLSFMQHPDMEKLILEYAASKGFAVDGFKVYDRELATIVEVG